MKHRMICLLVACLLSCTLLLGCAQNAATSDTTQAASQSVEDPVSLVQNYLEQDVSELIAVIGEPISRSYATSCGGEGEDGELVYDGFTVYTFRNGDTEIVKDVWAD